MDKFSIQNKTNKKNHTTQLLTSQQKMQISKKNILKMHMK
jgi:hypothetical protein